MQKVEEKNGKLTLLIEKATFSQMNLLRRLTMNEVPVMAVEEVEFAKNSSILYDEIIAHRLGLVPLTTDLKSYTLPTEEERASGEYPARSHVKATLTAKGPRVVYAGDLDFKDPKIKPVYPEMPIVKLLEGQEVELVATATLGIGREHAKWSPCLASYRQKPTLKLGKVDAKSVGEALKESKLKGLAVKGGKLAVDEKQLLLDEHPDAYEDLAKGITVEYDENTFIFTIESWGQLSPQEILTTAIERALVQLKEVDGLVKAL